jgi:hypothetical protein
MLVALRFQLHAVSSKLPSITHIRNYKRFRRTVQIDREKGGARIDVQFRIDKLCSKKLRPWSVDPPSYSLTTHKQHKRLDQA